MICTCERCLYTFEISAQPEQCPDCGKHAVRAATTREISEFRRIRLELESEPAVPWYQTTALPQIAYGY